MAAAISFTLISRARFTWVRRAHRHQLFLVLCSHNARTQLLRELPRAHLAVCVMAGEGGKGQIKGSVSYGACGGAGTPQRGFPREEASRAVPVGGHPVPALSPSWTGGSQGRALSPADARGSSAGAGARAAFGRVGGNGWFSSPDFWVLSGLGESRVLPQAAPALPGCVIVPPRPALAADVQFCSEKASFCCLATLSHLVQWRVQGGVGALCGGALSHLQPPPCQCRGRGAVGAAQCWRSAWHVRNCHSVSWGLRRSA